MQQAIIGFHLDDEDDWVAKLECGHHRHVRHQPPFFSRPWAISEAGRSKMLGTVLFCRKCDQGAERDF